VYTRKEVMKYIFKSGLINNRWRDKICTIGWIFETDPDYCMCYFDNGGSEVGKVRELIPLDK
jgi:hypothetical protein